MSALELSQMALIGPPNIKRILLARLALTMADPKQTFPFDELNKICKYFTSTEYFIQLTDILQNLSSDSFICWHHDTLLPIYLRQIINANGVNDCEKLQVRFIFSIENIAFG